MTIDDQRYQLPLGRAEAATLFAVLRRVAGDPDRTSRGHAAAVLARLRELGLAEQDPDVRRVREGVSGEVYLSDSVRPRRWLQADDVLVPGQTLAVVFPGGRELQAPVAAVNLCRDDAGDALTGVRLKGETWFYRPDGRGRFRGGPSCPDVLLAWLSDGDAA